jgi:serine/threonine protein kinase
VPLIIGQFLANRYRIDVLLGQGGMGAVYRAWDTRLNIAVAVKENLDASPEAERQFWREAQILARLSHPNLPHVTDHFSISGQGQYLVMDFIEGEDVQSLLDRYGVLPETQILPWLAQVCDALIYLHGQTPPIIHRDIKPANIEIRPDGRVLLVDFGIAKLHDPQQGTTVGAKAITPGFSPPEQYSGHTDARSDIYALGATLYALLTGRTLPESVLRVAHQQTVVRPRQVNPQISPGVEQAILRATEIDADHRYPDAAHFRADLVRQSNQVAVAKRPPAVWRFAPLLPIAAIALVILIIVAVRSTAPAPVVQTVTPAASNVSAPATATITAAAVDLSPTSTRVVAAIKLIVTPKPTSVELKYQSVSLEAIANASLSADYAAPPIGQQTLADIPFSLKQRVFKSQARPSPNDTFPTRATLDLNVPHAEAVYLLLTAGNAFTRWNGRTLGRVTLYFDRAAPLAVDLVLGRNLREWHAASNVVSTAPGVEEVWRGALAAYPDLEGAIDLLTIAVPPDRREATLTRLEIEDVSTDNVGSLDPALTVSSITVAYR